MVTPAFPQRRPMRYSQFGCQAPRRTKSVGSPLVPSYPMVRDTFAVVRPGSFARYQDYQLAGAKYDSQVLGRLERHTPKASAQSVQLRDAFARIDGSLRTAPFLCDRPTFCIHTQHRRRPGDPGLERVPMRLVGFDSPACDHGATDVTPARSPGPRGIWPRCAPSSRKLRLQR